MNATTNGVTNLYSFTTSETGGLTPATAALVASLVLLALLAGVVLYYFFCYKRKKRAQQTTGISGHVSSGSRGLAKSSSSKSISMHSANLSSISARQDNVGKTSLKDSSNKSVKQLLSMPAKIYEPPEFQKKSFGPAVKKVGRKTTYEKKCKTLKTAPNYVVDKKTDKMKPMEQAKKTFDDADRDVSPFATYMYPETGEMSKHAKIVDKISAPVDSSSKIVGKQQSNLTDIPSHIVFQPLSSYVKKSVIIQQQQLPSGKASVPLSSGKPTVPISRKSLTPGSDENINLSLPELVESADTRSKGTIAKEQQSQQPSAVVDKTTKMSTPKLKTVAGDLSISSKKVKSKKKRKKIDANKVGDPSSIKTSVSISPAISAKVFQDTSLYKKK